MGFDLLSRLQHFLDGDAASPSSERALTSKVPDSTVVSAGTINCEIQLIVPNHTGSEFREEPVIL